MKRSDAIKQLKYWLFGATNDSEKLKEAESLLTKIEDMGMLPPKTMRTDPGHFKGDSFKYSVNEWTPEDENEDL